MSYGWTEEYIFDLPWDRARVYLDEIMIYHDQPVVRKLPQLPEELKLQELMQQMVAVRRTAMLSGLSDQSNPSGQSD